MKNFIKEIFFKKIEILNFMFRNCPEVLYALKN